MALRAQAHGGMTAPAADVKLVPRPDAELPQDEVVMVLLTRQTFDAARAIGQARGEGPAEVFAAALRALIAQTTAEK